MTFHYSWFLVGGGDWNRYLNNQFQGNRQNLHAFTYASVAFGFKRGNIRNARIAQAAYITLVGVWMWFELISVSALYTCASRLFCRRQDVEWKTGLWPVFSATVIYLTPIAGILGPHSRTWPALDTIPSAGQPLPNDVQCLLEKRKVRSSRLVRWRRPHWTWSRWRDLLW